MFVTEQEADERLKSERNLLRDGKIQIQQPSAPPADAELEKDESWPEPELDAIALPCLSSTDSLEKLERLIASGTALENRASYKGNREAQKAIGEIDSLLGPSIASSIMGLSPSQSQAYGDGLQSAYTDTDLRPNVEIKEVKKHIELVKLDIAVKATSRLRRIMIAMNDTRIDAIQSPIVLAKVGRDVASIIEKVSPKEFADPDRGSIHIYRPESSPVNEYKIININVGAQEKAKLTEVETKFYNRALSSEAE